MNPKAALFALITIGCIAVGGLWAWTLAPGIRPPDAFAALLGTILFFWLSAYLARVITSKYLRTPISNMTSGVLTGAGGIAIIGSFVLFFEAVPSRNGPSNHVDRRYCIIFFALAAYLALFRFIDRKGIY